MFSDRASQSRCRLSHNLHGIRWFQVSLSNFVPRTEATFTDSSRFVEAILKAARGETGITEAAYVYLPGIEGGAQVAQELGAQYFATKLDFGPEGAIKAHPIGKLSAYEQKLLDAGLPGLKKNIEDGEKAVSS